MSLPLLEGLWRQPAASERVLKEALHRYEAAKRIAKWCVAKRYQQMSAAADSTSTEPRRKKRRMASSSVKNTERPTLQSSYEHWLFRALDSSILAVRQMTARILFRHKAPADAILDHLQASNSSTASPGDVQSFGLLTELSGVHLRTWKWAGRELKRLACHSTQSPTRIVLLIHYLHAMSLAVEREHGDRRLFYDYLWSSSSLLSNLIAAHVMLVERRPGRGLHVATQLLAKLVDPNATPASSTTTKIRSESEDLATSSTTATAASVKRQLLRLERLELETGQLEMETVEEQDDEEEDEQEDDDDDDEIEEEGGDDDPDYQLVIRAGGEGGESENDGDEDDEEDDDDGEDENDEEQNGNQDNDAEMTEAEQEIVDVVLHFEERLMDINDDGVDESRPSSSSREQEATQDAPADAKRQAFYLQASLQVLNAQHIANNSYKEDTKFLTTTAEQRLLLTICNVIQPPKKPLNIKIFMRRAPSQEEFFRGSLTRNPIPLSHLSTSQQEEPTVRHLRQYIADQLQMSETAELLELLCANKILNLDLKLRVVHQVLWKTHLLENSSSVFSSGGVGAPTFFSTGSGLSMVFSSDRTDRRSSITSETPASALPPTVVTYRLAGVDGEATEDLVETLNDPEAPLSSNLAPEEQERLMENEFGLTRLVTDGRGINVLLRSLQSHIKDTLRRIRRDDVAFKRSGRGKRCEKNLSLAKFEKSSPFAGLVLLNYCTKLPSNCKKLVDARAPTILLRLLLDVLNAIDESSSADAHDNSADQNAQVVSNPTAVLLEDLIETLASDISTDADTSDYDMEVDEGSNTLPLLLSSLKTIYLGPQLRKVIAKLLPFLTYGLPSLARELAENFETHVKVEKLSDCEAKEQPKTRRFVLMETFVQAAVCLPPNDVCHSLRSELLRCGFLEKLIRFILEDMPDQPPPWSTSLWPKASKKEDVADLEQSWKYYFLRSGIKTAIDMLVGLCRGHKGVQSVLAEYGDGRFINACHWIESTSDYKTVRICLNGLGLVAETLLDELKEENAEVAKMVGAIRRKTRDRKKEIADERRSKALVSMSSFGPVAGVVDERSVPEARSGVGGAIRSSASSFLAPVLGFFSPSTEGVVAKSAELPAWLAEMEALEDETGLTCAVCQEGRTLQPGELLGLYCYVKKVAIPPNKWGTRAYIDGAMLLMALPSSLPTSLVGTPLEHQWFSVAKVTGDSLRSSNTPYSNSTSGASQRPTQATTTVSAGNAIHCSCHSKARSADRNHPKAPKSEWEGASLRNSRVNCNVILPLVSSKSSKVPLVAVEMALTEYQNAISNLLGARPKAMLWTVLNDVRLLLLRMAYGESLNADCGGGSLSSNASLLFYQLLLVDMFTNDAEHDSPQTARHAICLSGGFLAACKIVEADDYDGAGKATHASLCRAIADAAPMAALTCIVYHNTKDEDAAKPEKGAMIPHPNRRWELNKEDFLCGLVVCAGRRHALGAEDSCCQTSRKGRPRQSSFSDWEIVQDESTETEVSTTLAATKRKGPTSVAMGKRGLLKIDDFANALRPMITLYAIFDYMSLVYVPDMTDEMIKESAEGLVKHVEDCQKAKGIHDLLRKAGVKLDNDSIIEELQKGMVSA